jgi:hypothetical protein
MDTTTAGWTVTDRDRTVIRVTFDPAALATADVTRAARLDALNALADRVADGATIEFWSGGPHPRMLNVLRCRATTTGTWLGRCKRCSTKGHPVGVRTDAAHLWNGWMVAVCDGCGSFVNVAPVAGTYNPAKVCNARCMGATGPACDCSCGGANHGGRWA